MAVVAPGVDDFGGHRLLEARPAALGVVLGVAVKKSCPADHAAVRTGSLLIEVGSGKGRFSTGFLGAVKGHGGEPIPEFSGGFVRGHQPDGSALGANGGLLLEILASNVCSQLRCCHSKAGHRHTASLGSVGVVTFRIQEWQNGENDG